MSISISYLKTPLLGLALSAAILGGSTIVHQTAGDSDKALSVLHTTTTEASSVDDTCNGWRSTGLGPCAGPNG